MPYDRLRAIAPERNRRTCCVGIKPQLLFAVLELCLFYLDDRVWDGRAIGVEVTMSARFDVSRPKVIGYSTARRLIE